MTTTALSPDVAPPPGTEIADEWGSGGPDRRVILGENLSITDSDLIVSTSCIQHIDGHIDDGSTGEGPSVYLDGSPVILNSDQARELASLLLALAAQLDGWATR